MVSQHITPLDNMAADRITVEHQSAQLTFKAGADIESIRLLSDLIPLQLTNLPSGAHSLAVRDILFNFGIEVPCTAIRMTSINPAGSVALVELEDADIVSSVCYQKIGDSKKGGKSDELSVKAVQDFARLGNRIQLNVVLYSWYRQICWWCMEQFTDTPYRKIEDLCYDHMKAEQGDAFDMNDPNFDPNAPLQS